jgi:putative ABC transport system permease protein
VNTLLLALRNLLRNRRRSLMTLIAMVLGMMAVLLFGGYIRAIAYGMQSDYVARTGHLQIQRKGYFLYGNGNPSAYGIRDYKAILATVKRDPVLAAMVLVATPTLQFGAIAGNFAAGVSRTIYASGIVVEDQDRMREWNDYGLRDVRQRLTLSGTPADSAVIGTGVARVLQLCTELTVPNCASPPALVSATKGDAMPDDIAALATANRPEGPTADVGSRARIEILAASSRGAPNVGAVNVVRAEFQGTKELDDVFLALHLAQAQKLLFGHDLPQVTAIALQLRHTAQVPIARERLEQILAASSSDQPLEILDFETLSPFYGQTLSMFATIFGFISVLIGSVVLFTISNTMSMTVVERTVEIGTVRAMGLRRGGIRAMFLAEAIVLGTFGSIVGVAMALTTAWAINRLGLTWTPPGRIEAVALEVRLAGEHLMMWGSAAALVTVASLSAILPAARASRMNIVDALRHV